MRKSILVFGVLAGLMAPVLASAAPTDRQAGPEHGAVSARSSSVRPRDHRRVYHAAYHTRGLGHCTWAMRTYDDARGVRVRARVCR